MMIELMEEFIMDFIVIPFLYIMGVLLKVLLIITIITFFAVAFLFIGSIWHSFLTS